MGYNKSSSKREVYRIHSYLKKQEKIQNRQPNFKPKTTGKKNNKPPKLVEGKKS